ncbi:EF-P beta-lysylation protein EpmB [Marinibactrum halimedae]|uniref:L-lysine 2,3-aminomutase n=1 Tax=Marinibactrum halimedae TaxID=1444977 RepID=A0AA37T7Z0_9GAMM|nr:EF-P beta-lysylation protein EpmB [Marinibactrum halimedae]MCD9460256.1 EF-P beta-lysylation protein EpmB [Marinibactrum halimedae]GLS24342.1 EF-P beta-lysylation protein EpmB [Marinibactrum halimedae]
MSTHTIATSLQTETETSTVIDRRWQEALQTLITDPRELITLLELPEEALQGALASAKDFPLKVPRPFIEKMKKGDLNDPLLKQVLPIHQEQDAIPGFTYDPLEESESNPVPGLIHKYRSRVLIVTSSQCAIHCRYCFRRHFPYEDNRSQGNHWSKMLHYLQQHPQVNEVIFSGGDPLSIGNRALINMLNDIETIAHIKRVRFHTRLPVVIPERLDTPLIEALANSTLKTLLVIHTNHPNELDTRLAKRLHKAQQAGITLLNQTVLLKGINDCADVLSELSEALFAAGVMPYYLHLLDRVSGAAHFEVSEKQAQTLYKTLLGELPGFLVPKLVREIAGKESKTPISVF